MPSLTCRALACIFFLATSAIFAVAQVPAKPLDDGDLLALVAGGALTENIVNEIQLRGLAFHPSDPYRSQLETAGAGRALLSALDSAKISAVAESPEGPHRVEVLQHLARAAGLMRNKRLHAFLPARRDLHLL